MCRNIHTLYNMNPPVSQEDIRAAALQYVRKISGFNKPSKANQAAFMAAAEEIAAITTRLFATLETGAPLREHKLRTPDHHYGEPMA